MLSLRMAGPFQPHRSLILQLRSGYGQVLLPVICSCSWSIFPAAAPQCYSQLAQWRYLLDCHGFHRLDGQKMSHWCLNVPSGYPQKSHLHQWVKNQELDPCSYWRFGHLKGKKWRRTLSQPYLQPFSHTASSPIFPAYICNSWFLKDRMKGCRGVYYVKTYQQYRPFQARNHPSTAVRANKTQGHTSPWAFLKLG